MNTISFALINWVDHIACTIHFTFPDNCVCMHAAQCAQTTIRHSIQLISLETSEREREMALCLNANPSWAFCFPLNWISRFVCIWFTIDGDSGAKAFEMQHSLREFTKGTAHNRIILQNTHTHEYAMDISANLVLHFVP